MLGQCSGFGKQQDDVGVPLKWVTTAVSTFVCRTDCPTDRSSTLCFWTEKAKAVALLPASCSSLVTNLFDEELDDLEVSLGGGGDEGGELVPVLAVHVQAVLEERLNGVEISVGRGGDEP